MEEIDTLIDCVAFFDQARSFRALLYGIENIEHGLIEKATNKILELFETEQIIGLGKGLLQEEWRLSYVANMEEEYTGHRADYFRDQVYSHLKKLRESTYWSITSFVDLIVALKDTNYFERAFYENLYDDFAPRLIDQVSDVADLKQILQLSADAYGFESAISKHKDLVKDKLEYAARDEFEYLQGQPVDEIRSFHNDLMTIYSEFEIDEDWDLRTDIEEFLSKHEQSTRTRIEVPREEPGLASQLETVKTMFQSLITHD